MHFYQRLQPATSKSVHERVHAPAGASATVAGQGREVLPAGIQGQLPASMRLMRPAHGIALSYQAIRILKQ